MSKKTNYYTLQERFQCDYCHKSFITKKTLVKHLEKDHGYYQQTDKKKSFYQNDILNKCCVQNCCTVL